MEINKEHETTGKDFTKIINNNQQINETNDCDQNELKSDQNELFDDSLQFFLNDNENYDEQNENDNSDKSPNYKRQSNQLLREQDRFLPIANISRIMKNKLPDKGKISKEAKVCIQECVSEFISFITSEASERCTVEKRKTINGDDILVAMETLGFDNYIKPLKVYLQKFRKLNATVNLNNNDLDPLINN